MSFFSFKKGNAIAQVEGGMNDKKILYIDREEDDECEDICCSKCTPECGITKRRCCKQCRNMQGGCYSCGGNIEYNNMDDIEKLFYEEMDKLKKNKLDKVDLKGAKFLPVPKRIEGQNERVMITGPSGAGKSTWASKYGHQYKKMYPKNKIILFSNKEKDACLDELKPLRMKLDYKLVDDPISASELNNTLVIFDDIDQIKNLEIRYAVQELRDLLMAEGRSEKTNVITISHNPTNHKQTVSSLLESSSIVMFPEGGDTYHIEQVLKKYCGLHPKKIRDVLDLNSRWVMCSKTAPKYLLHEKGAFFPK